MSRIVFWHCCRLAELLQLKLDVGFAVLHTFASDLIKSQIHGFIFCQHVMVLFQNAIISKRISGSCSLTPTEPNVVHFDFAVLQLLLTKYVDLRSPL